MPRLSNGGQHDRRPARTHKHPDGAEEWMAFFKDDEGRDLALHSIVR